MIFEFQRWLANRRKKRQIWLDNQSIKREAWIYACNETAKLFNEYYNNSRPGTIFTGRRRAKYMFYYDKMKELGGKF